MWPCIQLSVRPQVRYKCVATFRLPPCHLSPPIPGATSGPGSAFIRLPTAQMTVARPRRLSLPSLRRRGSGCRRSALRAVQRFMSMPSDDPQLLRLAAAAVLLAGERAAALQSSGWSTVEMDQLRDEVQQLESSWTYFMSGPGGAASSRARSPSAANGGTRAFDVCGNCGCGADTKGIPGSVMPLGAAAEGAALYVAYRDLEAAVLSGKQLPVYDQLLVNVARVLLWEDCTTPQEVEAAVRAGLVGCTDFPTKSIVPGIHLNPAPPQQPALPGSNSLTVPSLG